ncbi:WXG100 family type VII secretion target [Streptomyces lydicus]|uniref:WXG100 family type VII secretion target n=1 Tax=Streptomyces lydicus TaxID=47763 RepID=UPI00101140E6|nr:WXG100 family type VII secretion target [Streptomyces lydicus]MCZ1009082.1 WXG100 family type VII secretion target [Streptomyces lydicus]
MADSQHEQQPKIEKSFNLFNPGGDPSVLRACAEAWRHMAHDLKSTVEAQDHEVTRLGDNWTGAAADAFHAHWKHTRSQVEKALPQFATVAHQLDTTADAIQKANDEVHRVVEEVLATVAIGIGLSVLTAGFSDAIAAGAAEAEIAEATAEVTRLGQLLIRVAKEMERVKEAMADSKLLKFAIEFGKNTGANFIGNVGGKLVTGQEITWRTTGQDLQDAAVAGLVGTGITEGAGRIGEKVDKWATSTGQHAAEGAWAPGKAIGAGLEGKNLLGRMATEGVGSAGGQAAADGAEIIFEGEDKDILRDAAFSGAAGATAGGANHAGEKINDGGGEHRATNRNGFPGWQQIPVDGTIYGAGNAANTELGSSD